MTKTKTNKKSIFLYIPGIVIWSVALTFMSLYFTSMAVKDSAEVFGAYFSDASVFFVNFIPILSAVVFIYYLSNRMWISYLISTVIITLMSLVNNIKISLRDEPFVVSDLSLFKEAVNIGERYTYTLNSNFYIFLGIALVLIVISAFLFKPVKKNIFKRLCGIAAPLIVMSSVLTPLYINGDVYEIIVKNNDYLEEDNFEKTDNYVCRGIVYSFLHSMSDLETKPQGYSHNNAKKILAKYSYDNIPDDKKINIIAIMLESFNDFSKFSSIEFTNNPYDSFHKLQKKSISGNIFTSSLGGGTIQTERSFITGYSSHINYLKPTMSYARYFKEQGYTVEGCHPGYNWFYEREKVNKLLGFDNYKFFENGYEEIYESNPNRGDKILEDKYFFDDVFECYEKNKETGKPYFNFSVSYQNHGPYDETYIIDGKEYIKKTGNLSDEGYYILNNYLAGIDRTIKEINRMVEKADKEEEPLMLVFFGDHNPWLGNGSFVYDELNIEMGFDTQMGLYNYFSVPYIIYCNDGAKEIAGNDCKGNGGVFSTMFLMNKIFETAGWKGNEFMKVTNYLFEKLHIITNIGLCKEDGIITENIRGPSLERLKEFRILQYYMRNKAKPTY